MSDTTDYQPISCELYSEYELAILRRSRIWLRWRDAEGMHHFGVVQLRDLETRNHEEFLHLTDAAGERHRIRLDQIIERRDAES